MYKHMYSVICDCWVSSVCTVLSAHVHVRAKCHVLVYRIGVFYVSISACTYLESR